MIRAIEIENVRIFEGKGWNFQLSPLTVFCGTNSSGKSTLLKVLLLLRQSMGIMESYTHDRSGLRLVGSQVDLGTFKSFVSHNEIKRDITISLVIDVKIPSSIVEDLKSLRTNSRKKNSKSSEGSSSTTLKSTFRFSAFHVDNTTPIIFSTDDRQEIIAQSTKGIMKEADYQVICENESLLNWKILYAGSDSDGDPRYYIHIPRKYIDKYQRFSNLKFDQELEGYAKLRVLLKDLMPQIIVAQPASLDNHDIEDQEEEDFIYEPLPPIIYHMSRSIQRTLDNIYYIGPLRSAAKRFYITQPGVEKQLDPTGEFIPYVLRDISQYSSWYVSPGLHDEPRNDPLFIALTRWMYFIRTGKILEEEAIDKELDWDVTRKVLLEIAVRSPSGDEFHSLADSGFGYSQLLPIVMNGLLAPKNHVLIIEQPELHLNPALQVRMAEFLVSLALADKQVLIETHSEHIVNTIRVLTAEDESNRLSTMCEILYIEMSKKLNRPKVHKLSIEQDGTVPNWPRQFFGEATSLTGRLLKTQNRHKKQS